MKKPIPSRIVLLIGIIISLISIVLIVRNASLSVNQTSPPTQTSSPQSPAPQDLTEKPLPQVIVVKFKSDIPKQTIDQVLSKYNAVVTDAIPQIGLTVLEVAAGKEDAVVEGLKQEPSVERVRREYPTRILFTPNDTDFRKQWGLLNTGQMVESGSNRRSTPGGDVKAETAWDVARGGGVAVAILDSGIDLNHPDLVGKVIAQNGFQFGSVRDGNGHGTHVAGIIAANTGNNIGIAGMCPDCKLMIGKVLGDNGRGDLNTPLKGIIWAADSGAKVINMSLGSYSPEGAKDFADAIKYATSKRAVIVAAAGNDNTSKLSYPGAAEGVVTVAATNPADEKARFSNYGNWVEIAAPGQSIYSTLPTYPYQIQSQKGTKLSYDYADGTSMASPMVAGIMGLVWGSKYGTSHTAVINRVYTTTDKIKGTGTFWTKGRVNATAALGGTANPPRLDESQPPIEVGPAEPIDVGVIVAPTPTPAPTSPINPTNPGGPIGGNPGNPPFPTVHCVGGAAQAPCATVPPSKPNPTGINLPTPTGGNPGNIGNPGNPANPSDPCQVTNSTVSTSGNSIEIASHKSHTKYAAEDGGLIYEFIKLILELLKVLLDLLLGNPPQTPGSPVPTPTSVPVPTVQPTPCITSAPTAIPTITTVPTEILTPTIALPTTEPTATAAPTLALTPTIFEQPTSTLAPTAGMSGTPTITMTPSVTPTDPCQVQDTQVTTQIAEDEDMNIFEQLFAFLLKLIELLLELIFGKQPPGGSPTPTPTPTPCPS